MYVVASQIVERNEMDSIQLMVKSNLNDLESWTMSIYKPNEEDESQNFKVMVSKEKSSERYLIFYVEKAPVNLPPYILELSRSTKIEMVVGQFLYSQNKREIERLRELLMKMLPCHDVEDAKLGIALYDDKMKETLGIDKPIREVEIITV